MQTKKEDYNVRQSNGYIILYAALLTIVSAGLLAFVSQALLPLQQANVELERKKNILESVTPLAPTDDINALYAARVKERVIRFDGSVAEGVVASSIDVAAEYKKAPRDRQLPVYEFRNPENPDQLDFVVLPVYGFGLWDNIWGFVALQKDMTTIQGVKFAHKGETPGLGARIESDEIQNRYQGKSIFDAEVLVSVAMMKGEGLDYADDQHKVDGMSGATLTAKGVNSMLKDYLACYEAYLKNNKLQASL